MFKTTSQRERRLWTGSVLVLVATWSLVIFAGALVPSLREQGLLGASFGLGFLLGIVAVAWGALRMGETGREVWIGLALGVAIWMVLVRMGVPGADRTHVVEYGLLAVLIHAATCERRRNGANGPRSAHAAIPNRVLDPRDFFVNALAAVVVVAASVAPRTLRLRLKSDWYF